MCAPLEDIGRIEMYALFIIIIIIILIIIIIIIIIVIIIKNSFYGGGVNCLGSNFPLGQLS